MAASRGSAYRPPRNSRVPVVERAAYPFGHGVHVIASAETLGGRYALPRDTAMTKRVGRAITDQEEDDTCNDVSRKSCSFPGFILAKMTLSSLFLRLFISQSAKGSQCSPQTDSGALPPLSLFARG
jgi:hypothetical protein